MLDLGDDVPCRIGLLFEVRVGCAVWHDPVRSAVDFGNVLVAYTSNIIGAAGFSNSKKHTNSILLYPPLNAGYVPDI